MNLMRSAVITMGLGLVLGCNEEPAADRPGDSEGWGGSGSGGGSGGGGSGGGIN